jgi:sulfatase maturation enzyme AslB (radical SAM superfamily)
MGVSDTFCTLPFGGVAVDPSGRVRLCCHSHALPLDDNGKQYDVGKPGFRILDALNGPLHREVRTAMLRGEKPSACNGCWDLAARGGTSGRKIWNAHFAAHLDEYVASVDADGRLAQPRANYFELSLGNTCNLRCRTCFPSASSQWIKEARILKLHADDYLDTLEDSPWLRAEGFWRTVDDLLPAAQRLNIMGGEPLFIDEHYEILRRAVAGGHAANIELQYTSNLTKLPPELKDLWRAFKSVTIAVSIDGVGAVGEYIRFPLRWTKFEQNVQTLIEWQKEMRLDVLFHATLSALSVFNIADVFRYVHSLGLRYYRIPKVTWVVWPTHLAPEVLPADIKRQVYEKNMAAFAALDVGLEDCETRELDAARAAMSRLVGEQSEEKRLPLFEKLLTITAGVDRLREQDVATIIPQWRSFG